MRAGPCDCPEFSDAAVSFEIVEPLVVRVKVDPDYVKILWVPAQFRRSYARQHVPGLVLGAAIGLSRRLLVRMRRRGSNVDDRVDRHHACFRRQSADDVHRRERGPHQLLL